MKHIILWLMCAVMLCAESFTCKVIHVSDGDTVTVLTASKGQIKLRLFGIDAPEKKQAYGQKSKEALALMITEQEVNIHTHGQDRYSRTIATIYLHGQDINAEQVKQGFAWAYVKYSKKYITLENEAREQQIGLWRDTNPIAPWEWRKR